MNNEVKQTIIEQNDGATILVDPVVERKKALKRFNRLYLYLPLGITLLLACLVMGAVLVATLINGNAAAQSTSSGLADLLVIAVILFPTTLIMTAIAGLCLYVLYKRRERGSMVRAPLQKGATKVGGYIDSADTKAQSAQESIAQRIIKVNSRGVQAKSLVRNVTKAARDTLNDIF